MSELHHDTVIVGAGPSGLAVAACLKRLGRPYLLLEREPSLASTWRRHYDRLHLHTAKQYSSLPHHPMPASYPTYPSRAQVVAYLDDYAKALELDVRTGVHVTAATHARDHWRLESPGPTYLARHLVVATGYNAAPVVPTWPGLETFPGPVLHASQYQNGAPYVGHDVLVVGAGNSGAEIAIDLWEHGARPAMVFRGPVHVVPRDVFGQPAQTVAIALAKVSPRLADKLSLPLRDFVVGDLSRWGIHRPDVGPAELLETRGRVPLIDIGTIALIKQGDVVVYPNISKIETSTVHFLDGRQRDFSALVLATGYTSNLPRWLHAPAILDERGLPRVHGADAGDHLYFLGFRNPTTGNLREIALEAQRIAHAIARA